MSSKTVEKHENLELDLKSGEKVAYEESERANSPLSAFFYEVNRIRRGSDRKKRRDGNTGSYGLLISSYNLSKRDLSDIKSAAFFNRRYGVNCSTESLREGSGVYMRGDGMFSRTTVDSGQIFDESSSVKTSLDYDIYDGNNVYKVIDSPLKAPTIHNVEYREYYDKNLCIKESNNEVNIFENEVSKVPEKKSFFLKGARKSSSGKGSEKKSTLRSISLNLKNLITSIVSNNDSHAKQAQIENKDEGKSLQKENEFSDPTVLKTENVLGGNLSNEKRDMTKSSFSEFYSRNLRKDIQSVEENGAIKMKEDVPKRFLEDEEKNKNKDVTVNVFKNSKNDYHMSKKNYQTYVSNDDQEIFNDDLKYKYNSEDVPYDDGIKNNAEKLKTNIEESSVYESDSEISQRLPSYCKLDAIDIGNFELNDFMIRKSSNISTKEISQFKSKIFEDEALNEKKINDSNTEQEEKSYIKSNDFSDKLTKADSNFEISHSDAEKYKPDNQPLNDNKNANIYQSTVNGDSNISISLPLLGDQLLSDFNVSLDDVSDAIDKVIEVRKRGYIMRQNVNIVHASSNDVCEKDTKRERYASPKIDDIYEKNEKHPVLKFDKTKNIVINKVPQDDSIGKKPDSGLLFIRVIEIENLDLPLPEDKTLRFCCTLDNGRHYITTPWIPFTKNAKINEEFELVANDDLEFTLTLRLDYQPSVDHKKKDFIFSRIFSSSKKQGALSSFNPPNCCLSNNGSFGRSYLSLKMFKDHAFGCPYTTTVSCMNEWTEKAVVKGRKRQILKVKSYIICQLKINAFYVPFVPGQAKETMPKSLSACVKDIKNAEWVSKLHYEGFLIQHGGDCLYRKRRYFRLSGLKLTSYHESSKSIRSNINLAKVKTILNDQQLSIDSKKMTRAVHTENNKQSSTLEGDNDYVLTQNGFCIKFFNGEIINFYADSEDEKARWVRVLDAVIKKANQVKPWCLYVLQKQKAMKRFPPKSALKKN
ncbi:hypothetical protein T552_01185 [Pneumocystis carinii B80]|uniref:PH domain-containing protein n=1 Tax=Pneumocystis carinii (strain B80) TaxID=1408658 RepID=A0A0W4ZLH2_PNEC8|nr:hypothetical protein T552_01185 [Pneumocystis carinii B80]KTW29229.1 hypothetical protein T552_01185 [Pneumocystis carinii B80]